uniref:Stimulator of chondrogenesis 1 n=1 Tax=Astyanax mexicanus TaxID=7994 RepID=A0A8B9RKB0_ASTMX
FDRTLIFLAAGMLEKKFVYAVPSSRWSCYKKVLKDRNCHSIGFGLGSMRPIGSLENHFWEGNSCDMVCYCNFSELLCCPSPIVHLLPPPPKNSFF